MTPISLKPSAKGVTAMIVVAVVIFFGCALAYMGASGKLRQAHSELEASQKEVSSAKEIVLKLEKSRLDYLDAKSQLRYLEASISTQDYVPTLLKQLEHLGKSVNLKVLGVRPVPVANTPQTRSMSSGADAAKGDVEGASQQKAGPEMARKTPAVAPYDELKIDVSVEGRYMNALEFLYRLNSFPKIVAVNSLDIDPIATTDGYYGSPGLNIKLNVTAFVFKSAGQRPAAPADGAAANSSPVSKGGTGNAAG